MFDVQFVRTTKTMPIPTELQHVLTADSEHLSGALRFKGTRVPVQALLDTLDGGTIEDFLDGWPNVPREFADEVIRWQLSEARLAFGIEKAS